MIEGLTKDTDAEMASSGTAGKVVVARSNNSSRRYIVLANRVVTTSYLSIETCKMS